MRRHGLRRFALAITALMSGCASHLGSRAVGSSVRSAAHPEPRHVAWDRPAQVDWPTYGGDLHNTRYSALEQIDSTNFNRLTVAWRLRTDAFGPRPEYKLEGTPLEVQGVLYATAGTARSVVAIDATTGQIRWKHAEDEGRRAAVAPRQLSGRGLAYWTDGHEERILYVTQGYRLVALNAKTGTRVSSFGRDGIVDLKEDDDQPIDLVEGEIGLQSPPAVAGDVIVVGAAFRDGSVPKTHRSIKGFVRGYDVHTGKRLWIFHTVPKRGEVGYETWLNQSADENGNTGVWTQISVDAETGSVYLPVESPTGDFYGGHRPGEDLFGDSLVCLDLHSGERKWHFQLVHHPIWDLDVPCAPILADVTVNGKTIKAVAQLTKQGLLYVFDRATGTPVWPIEERAVPKGDVPGEWYSPTQPFPTRPSNFNRNGVSIDDLIDFTPELHEKATRFASMYRLGPVFTPPVVSKTDGPVATISLGPASGGPNWPGGAFDPETHLLYVFAQTAPAPLALGATPTTEISDMRYVAGTAGRPEARRGAGEGPHLLANDTPGSQPPKQQPRSAVFLVDGLPLLKPPYGALSAISLDKGEIVWQVPHGETPDVVRNHPALKGVNIGRTGQSGMIGTLVTKTLVIAGDPQFTTSDTHPRGAMLHAYEKASGREVGAVYLPAPQSGSPMTYMVGDRQYLVVAVSGGMYSGEYIAFALPAPGSASTERETKAGTNPPDGARRTVWDGVYTEEQAKRGGVAYRRECGRCHGAVPTGGGEAPSLVGPSFLANWSGQTVSDLIERIHRSMPPEAPDRLTIATDVDIVAYILSVGKFPLGATELDDKIAHGVRIVDQRPSP